jgi:hypothetical protein
MKSDGNCGYYAIISQIIPNYFRGNILVPEKDIPLFAKKVVNELREKVLQYNKNKLNNYDGEFISDNYKIEKKRLASTK